MSDADLTPTYYVTYDDEGRILVQGQESRDHVLIAIAQGERRLITGPRNVTMINHGDYVDLTGPQPVVKPRPTWTTLPTPAPLLPKQEAVIPGLPPCTIAFSGPVNGSQAHDAAGDASIGFSVPGTYTLTLEPFPYLPVTMTLKVNPATVGNALSQPASVNLSVKL